MIDDSRYPFIEVLNRHGLKLAPLSIDTLQVNVGKLCNQACQHCHVDASPYRTEEMDRKTVDQCLKILRDHPAIKNLDITGGAPELNTNFDYLVEEGRLIGKHVMVRHNLTVSLDGHPRTKESKAYLPEFFAQNNVEVIASLPYYQEYFTDKQRGKGVFRKSIEGMKRLNAVGYGKEGGSLALNLVYNPVGSFLPAAQAGLEAGFKRRLYDQFGIVFNRLYTITNMPIHRFKNQLEHLGTYEEYMTKLVNAFNPGAAQGVMCRSMLSVGFDGKLYDCDFNQMAEMPIGNGRPMTVWNFDFDRLMNRRISFASHCLGCTAGAGSSCGGATT